MISWFLVVWQRITRQAVLGCCTLSYAAHCADEQTNRLAGVQMSPSRFDPHLDDRPEVTRWSLRARRSSSMLRSVDQTTLARSFLQPAYWCFYTPFRQQKTNTNESLRLFWHAGLASEALFKEFYMARDKNTSLAVRGWANVTLSDEDKATITNEAIHHKELLAILADWVGDGYRLSVTWDEYSNALQATFVCANEEDPNYGYGLSARHPDLDMALQTLLYKCSMLKAVGWSDVADRPTRPSWS